MVGAACKETVYGKLTYEALNVHMSCLPNHPSILRLYEGCARAYIGVVLVQLQTLRVRYNDYSDSEFSPILHRKEELIPEDHPLHQKFERLTRQEER